MLILTRREGEIVAIGDDILLTVLAAGGVAVSLGISAPQHVTVDREEVRRRFAEGEME